MLVRIKRYFAEDAMVQSHLFETEQLKVRLALIKRFFKLFDELLHFFLAWWRISTILALEVRALRQWLTIVPDDHIVVEAEDVADGVRRRGKSFDWLVPRRRVHLDLLLVAG